MEKHIYTVTELTTQIRNIVEGNFSDVLVEGEISNFKSYPSGHMYFDLKDENAVLPAVMFNAKNRLRFEPENGMKVIANGRASIYPKSGKYQLIVESIEPAGKGALYLAFEQLKDNLKKEGLFDAEHKKPIPPFPEKIGIVTSIKGAAIRDILRTITERFPVPLIIINSVQVQGETAAREIACAINEFNELDEEIRPDVLIVGRGGGSIEDLWAFNEEVVARAIYDSRIPIISAVGHETDFTISDFVADVRALTPTDAGKRVVAKSKRELFDDLEKGWMIRLESAMEHALENRMSQLNGFLSLLRTLHPKSRIEFYQQQLDSLTSGLQDFFTHYISLKNEEVKNLCGKLLVLNPEAILERGYSVTFLLPEHEIIRDAEKVKKDDELEIKVKKGIIQARVN
ncbi:exodeoxyribonuclease VII large subunit [Candidatus Desantisbacteria bacterium CG_4_10_14_0_8_um_filter_39_17]|uniref:Exodeoxyribonuclease 7 large subunit n=1 Tax=Candidatus Desantisbacteria bacterium CG_4_10_14_0_8_um_filter_39_17 TaxID=1974542 RepID=A0A2H9PCU8_9BACT|nr:MAG: exodeoxyribonuclease VII large subunit [Candidatus Desantisbacteria bacterium CG_4_10_14_0_8_um_filter_39_17]